VIETARRAFSFISVGREVAHWRVVVSLALSGFFLYDAHGRPINVEFYSTKLTGLARRDLFEDSTDDNSILPNVNNWSFNTQRGQNRADLTPVISPMVERLREAN
jgi:hypothetical protein